MNNQTSSVGTHVARSIVCSLSDINHQLHGSARGFKHYAGLFRQFEAQDKPFMLVKVTATAQYNCRVPPRVEFFDSREKLIDKSVFYRKTEKYILFIDMCIKIFWYIRK